MSDEELSERRTVLSCPECDAANVAPRTDRNGRAETNYRCRVCGATFDQPREREAREGKFNARSSAGPRALLDADPETVPDGGRVTGGDDDGV